MTPTLATDLILPVLTSSVEGSMNKRNIQKAIACLRLKSALELIAQKG